MFRKEDNMDSILEYEELVYSIIKKYSNYYDIKDLYQAGMIGLINAHNNYQEGYNCKFSTYAHLYIRGEVYKYIRENSSIKISPDLYKVARSVDKARSLLTQKLSREPSDTELSLFLEIDEDLVAQGKMCMQQVKSLDYINEDGNENLYNSIKTEDKRLDSRIIDLNTELEKLNKEEKQIIYNYYFADLTQSEISKNLGMNQVQVSRKKDKILQKLRTRL